MPELVREQITKIPGASIYPVETEPGVWISTGRKPLDISSWAQEKMPYEALNLYRTNPLAFRIIELFKNFIGGPGISIEAPSEFTRRVLLDHWNDPINQWAVHFPERIKELSLFGELLLTIQRNGDKVLLGSINPTHIQALKFDTRNEEIIRKVQFKDSLNPPGFDPLPLEWDVVNYNLGTKKLEGDLFYFKINSLSASARGMSDLFPLAYWLNSLDDLLYQQLNRLSQLISWFWDITLTNASAAEVEKFIAEGKAQPPQPGGASVHTDSVKIEPLTPKFGGEDTSPIFNMFRDYILTGAGFPRHFVSGEAPRQNVEGVQESTFRMLTARQAEVKNILARIFHYVLDWSDLPEGEDRTFSILMPKISLRDLQRSGGALFRTSQALQTATQNEWINKAQAKEVFLALIDQLGLGIEIRTLALPTELGIDLGIDNRYGR